MKTIHLLLTLTLVIFLGSSAKAQYNPQRNVYFTTNYYRGKGTYPRGAFIQKVKPASSTPAKNIQMPNKPPSPPAQVIKKTMISHPSMINGYTALAGEDQMVYGRR